MIRSRQLTLSKITRVAPADSEGYSSKSRRRTSSQCFEHMHMTEAEGLNPAQTWIPADTGGRRTSAAALWHRLSSDDNMCGMIIPNRMELMVLSSWTTPCCCEQHCIIYLDSRSDKAKRTATGRGAGLIVPQGGGCAPQCQTAAAGAGSTSGAAGVVGPPPCGAAAACRLTAACWSAPSASSSLRLEEVSVADCTQ